MVSVVVVVVVVGFSSDFELITGIGEISLAKFDVVVFVVGVKLVRKGDSCVTVVVFGDLARDGVFVIDGDASTASNCSRNDATVVVVVVVDELLGFGDVGVGETSRTTVDGDCERG